MLPETHTSENERLVQALGPGAPGDGEPWRRCYEQMGARLVLYARQILFSGESTSLAEAEDVVQTAFVRFWRRYPNAPEDQYGLLFAAVRSAALDALRCSQRRVRREDVYFQEEAQVRDSSSQRSPERGWFEQGEGVFGKSVQLALERLPAEQREVVVLKIWGELTFAQIAEALEVLPNTVASRYRLAMKALRRELESSGGDAHE
jgi:RNA polymerase sigma-70 factor (ECF subfamily)